MKAKRKTKKPSQRFLELMIDYQESGGSDDGVLEYAADLEAVAAAAETVRRIAESVPEWKDSPNLKALQEALTKLVTP